LNGVCIPTIDAIVFYKNNLSTKLYVLFLCTSMAYIFVCLHITMMLTGCQ